jgi:hypothetical protein
MTTLALFRTFLFVLVLTSAILLSHRSWGYPKPHADQTPSTNRPAQSFAVIHLWHILSRLLFRSLAEIGTYIAIRSTFRHIDKAVPTDGQSSKPMVIIMMIVRCRKISVKEVYPLIKTRNGNIKGASKADMGNVIFRRFKSVILILSTYFH